MRLMREHDPQTQEDGFALLKPVAGEFVIELIDAYEQESDHGSRCWLLELIGHARSDEALPLFIRELASEDESLRYWAEQGLLTLGTKAARTALYDRTPSA